MLDPPTIPGWKVETIGDDIAWMKSARTAGSTRSTPSGFFGVAPGTNMQSNANAMITATRDSIFTNCALTPDGDVWWDGPTARSRGR